jgi:hypothetical protein
MSQNPQMDVLYMQGLGHVLGIFTRTSEPAQIETDASVFVGDGLHLRGSPPFPQPPASGHDLVVPPSMIGVFRAVRNWRQIFQPFNLYVSQPPSTPALSSFAAAGPTLGFTSPNLTITLTPATAGSALNILVLALDVNGGNPVPFSAQTTPGQTSVNIAMTGLVSGDNYNAFVFIPTLPVAVQQFTAP